MTEECIRTGYALNRDNGYGKITIDGKGHNHSRVVFAKFNGLKLSDLEGKVVRHLCNNAWCVNPNHLTLGSHKDNMQDKMLAGRWRGGQPKKLSQEQVKAIRKSSGPASHIAKEYGVSRQTILNVINKKSCYTD